MISLPSHGGIVITDSNSRLRVDVIVITLTTGYSNIRAAEKGILVDFKNYLTRYFMPETVVSKIRRF